MISIIDYGMGNLRSVEKVFSRIKANVMITSDKNQIINSEKIVLPGVGNFERGMYNLRKNGLFDVLNNAVLIKKIPILGICLGMQLMTEFSEEGQCNGFGWVSAETKKFNFNDKKIKIPHMGWNSLDVIRKNPIIDIDRQNNFVYFVHSYYVICNNVSDVITETTYGSKFVSSFSKNSIYGCQFHPEKSHDFGMEILNNFVKI